MKKRILLLAVILMIAASAVQAEEDNLGVTFDVTYVSSYIWRGFDIYGPGGHSAIQPSIDVDLYGSGWGFTVWWSRANSSGFENLEEIDYTVYYGNSLAEGERLQTDYLFAWTYYNYPDEPRNVSDFQEILASFSWPSLCPLGVVPSYTFVKGWPAVSNSAAANLYTQSGWLHVFGLGYDLVCPASEQVFNLGAELYYNDGFGGADVDHDWSHMVFSIGTEIGITDNLAFAPAFYYQASMDDSVNDDDETWVSLGMSYTF